MEVIGSLLTFFDSTCVVNNMFFRKLGVFNLLCVIGDVLLLKFRSLVIDVYTLYLIENNCIKWPVPVAARSKA